MSAYTRIQWLHKKIAAGCYPNSTHAVEKFGISQRQAQRDFETLKNEMGAPLKYSSARRGYYYTRDFELSLTSDETETEYIDLVSGVEESFMDSGDDLQLRLPYSAQIKIKDKLTVMNLRRFIISKVSRDVYNCEFFNVDNFLGILFTSDADISILSPDWLREKAFSAAERMLKNNS